MNSVKFSFDIWKNNIFPSILPFFIISSLLINYGFVELAAYIFKPLMFLFGINPNVSIAFVMSILSGFPSSSKYIKELLDKKLINEQEASKALMFTHFSNPLFILGTISSLLNKKIAIFILIIHYSTNIIIGILFRNYHNTYTKSKMNFKSPDSKDIGSILIISIKTSIEILLLILGSISVCSFICTIINHTFNFNNIVSTLINGLFEITQGLKYVSLLNIPIKLKTTISVMFLSFGGLSIHIQVKSILDIHIKYIPYFISRIIHTVISGILSFILFDIFI
nr:hypothetical protein [Bacilli bacterium]